VNNYETELAAAIEHGRAILAERQRQEDERRRQQEREAEERRQKHLAKLPEWARAFATVIGEYEEYINLAIPNCTPISLKSTSYRSHFDSVCISTPDSVEFRGGYWIVIFYPHWLDDPGNAPDIFDEAVAIAAGHYGALCGLQADADARNALPEDESPY
jgi:hypothetical protein